MKQWDPEAKQNKVNSKKEIYKNKRKKLGDNLDVKGKNLGQLSGSGLGN